MKITAKQKIINHILEYGEVDNYWCIDNRVTTRLGAVICELQKHGWEFRGKFAENSKNFIYHLLKKPGESSVKARVDQFFKDFPIKKQDEKDKLF